MARILFIEPFYGGSHRAFADGLQSHSDHDIVLITLPEDTWRSRMRRGGIELAEKATEAPGDFDAIVATDMLDIGQFLALTRPRFSAVPVMYYLHENQFTYPRPKGTKLNSWYGQVNYMSALAADAVTFNSEFHRGEFLAALRTLAGQPNNWLVPSTIPSIEAKSSVLPIGLDLARFDAHRRPADTRPLVLWNHRWEFDKAPAMFTRAVQALAREILDFDVALAGDPGPNPHPAMAELAEQLGDRVVQFGRVQSAAEYASLLWRSKVAVSTSRQEFFGIAMVEAMYCECVPIAPRALNFPAIVPAAAHEDCLFDDEADLIRKLRQAVAGEFGPGEFREAAARWDWSRVGPEWDRALNHLVDARL